MKYSLILTAGGIGSRLNLGYNKMMYEIDGRTILYYVLTNCVKDLNITEIIVVVNELDKANVEKMLKTIDTNINIKITIGGKERQDSVYNGLKLLDGKNEIVAVHDGARIFYPHTLIDECILKAKKYGASVVGHKLIDSIKKVNDMRVKKSLERKDVWCVQTPQFAKLNSLIAAHNKALRDNFYTTDEVALLEKYENIKAAIVENENENIKLTKSSQLDYIKFLLNKDKS